jgi:hypothetical protein
MKAHLARAKRVILLAALLALSLSVQADQTWQGTFDNQWTTPGNWSGNAPPGATDTVIYNNTSTGNLSNWLSQPFSIKGITLTVQSALLRPIAQLFCKRFSVYAELLCRQLDITQQCHHVINIDALQIFKRKDVIFTLW